MDIFLTKEQTVKMLNKHQTTSTIKSTLPILSNILIETKDDSLQMTTTDLDLGIITKVSAQIKQQGAITIPTKRFTDIIKNLPEEEFSLKVLKNNIAILSCGKCKFKLPGIPKQDFPKLPQLDSKEIIEVLSSELIEMLSLVEFAVSHEETRYVLNGILFEIQSKSICLAATDGRRLAKIERKAVVDPKSNHKFSFIIASKAIQEIKKNLRESEEENTILLIGDNHIVVKIGETTLVSRLIEGEFPNYSQVVPDISDNKIKVERGILLDALKRASLFTTVDHQAVRFEISKDKMTIFKQTPELGESREEIPVKHKGKDMIIGFNPNYLMDALKNLGIDEVNIELVAPEKPAVLREPDVGYVYVVLPVRLG